MSAAGSSRIRRNVVYGLISFAVPTLVVLAAYPILIRHLGAAKFGIYLLATSTSGTLAFLDFGVSAATLKFLAEDLALGKRFAAAEIVVTSLAFYGALGAICALVLVTFAPAIVLLLRVNPELRAESVTVFRLAGIQFGIFLVTTVFISIFKGTQRFQGSAIILASLSVFTFGGAIVGVALFGSGLIGVTAIGVAMNAIVLAGASVGGLYLCRSEGLVLTDARPSWRMVSRMFSFGSVMTLNSISGLLLYQIQRYLVGIFIGPAAVTVYQSASVPPSKIHAAVNAATEVMFPFSSSSRDRKHIRQVYITMLAGSGFVALAGFTPLFFFGRGLIRFWLGPSLANQIAPLLPIFAVAYLFLALSPAPYHLVNGLGKPWLNTIFYALNAALNVFCIGLFALGNITLLKFAWAFAIANVLTSVSYQIAIEVLIWGKIQLFEPREPAAAG